MHDIPPVSFCKVQGKWFNSSFVLRRFKKKLLRVGCKESNRRHTTLIDTRASVEYVKNGLDKRTQAFFSKSGTRYVSPAWWNEATGN